ncbi:hypothetical protein [Deinococcus misasensis]|uniref:hypothetical protein n=1 Tax=Deinococcus misasensis TaxID=392413 RepID=UPI0012F79986|nr:hypothetical protein [Deinococcus misasensis]
MTDPPSMGTNEVNRFESMVARKLAKHILEDDTHGVEQAAREVTHLLTELYRRLSQHCPDANVHQVLRDMIAGFEEHAPGGNARF